MNILLFSALGFAFLFSAAETEKKAVLPGILFETGRVFLGASAVAAVLYWGPAKTGFVRQDFMLAAVPAVYLLCSAARLPQIYFAAVCGLGFGINGLADLGVSVFLFAAFRILLISFRHRALFFRPPAFSAGLPLLTAQAFWISLFLAGLVLLPRLPH